MKVFGCPQPPGGGRLEWAVWVLQPVGCGPCLSTQAERLQLHLSICNLRSVAIWARGCPHCTGEVQLLQL